MVGTVEPLKPQGNAIDQTFVANRQINFDAGTDRQQQQTQQDLNFARFPSLCTPPHPHHYYAVLQIQLHSTALQFTGHASDRQ